MKGEACAPRGGSAREAKAPGEDKLQLLNTADVCSPCGVCHHPRPCPALCCRGCASLSPPQEVVPAHSALAHGWQEKRSPAHRHLPSEQR